MIDKRQFINKYCDIQTKDGVWRLGMIQGKLNKDQEVIEVSLDGWSSNKNQVKLLFIIIRNYVFIQIEYSRLVILVEVILVKNLIH